MRVLWAFVRPLFFNIPPCRGQTGTLEEAYVLQDLGHCPSVLPLAGSFAPCEGHSLVSKETAQGYGRGSPRVIQAKDWRGWSLDLGLLPGLFASKQAYKAFLQSSYSGWDMTLEAMNIVRGPGRLLRGRKGHGICGQPG